MSEVWFIYSIIVHTGWPLYRIWVSELLVCDVYCGCLPYSSCWSVIYIAGVCLILAVGL